MLGCEDEDESMDDEEMKPSNVNTDDKPIIEHKPQNYTIESDIGRDKVENNLSAKDHEREGLIVNENLPCNDDIKIIDLEIRGEEGSGSSYGRSTSDSPNEILASVAYNGIPSTSAPYSDRECDGISHLNESTSSSPIEATSR